MVVTTLTFAPGIGEQSVSVSIYDDNILEEEIEIFSAFLMSDVGDAVNISPNEATVIIQDEGDSMLKLINTAYIIKVRIIGTHDKQATTNVSSLSTWITRTTLHL